MSDKRGCVVRGSTKHHCNKCSGTTNLATWEPRLKTLRGKHKHSS